MPIDQAPEEEDSVLPTNDAAFDELGKEFVDGLIDKIILFIEALSGNPFHNYQKDFARRIVESVVIRDAEVVTALASRQSGKSETVANTVAGLMVILPRLARMFPTLLGVYRDGFWVGLFAPVEGQVETLYSRVVSRLTSERAIEMLSDPEIDDKMKRISGVTKGLRLEKCGSFCMMMTANPKAKIESKTFHLAIIDECQESDDVVVSKSISPMLAHYKGTLVKTGTPSFTKNNFYKSIQLNRRLQTRRGARQNHFQWDWKDVIKEVPDYEVFVRKEMLRIGEESDEFQMSYCGTVDTPVLTSDLTYIRAGDVVPGMQLVGFDEERHGKGKHRNFATATVLDAEELTLNCYELRLSDGTSVTVTGDHQWLVLTAGRRTVWKRTDELSSSDQLHRITDVWETFDRNDPDIQWAIAYLSAAFDGEGCLAMVDGRIAHLEFAQKNNVMLDQVKKCLDRLGFEYREYCAPGSDVHKLKIGSGRAHILRFLGTVRPARLMEKFSVEALGSIGRHDRNGKFAQPRVESVTPVGERQVMAIKTSTKTYVLNGLASHNCCKFILERGMFVTQSQMDDLSDISMDTVKAYHNTPCLVGIDPARKQDSTVVTVVYVDWDRPDEFGYFHHRVLNWLEIQGDDWEAQYHQITDFLGHYNILAIGVDANGVGDAVAQRLSLLIPRAEVVALTSSQQEQSERFKHLQALIQRGQIAWPGNAKARRLRTWKRFMQQMTDAEKQFKGPNFLVAAPDEPHAHDDYVDSLAIACSLSKDLTMPKVQISRNPFFS